MPKGRPRKGGDVVQEMILGDEDMEGNMDARDAFINEDNGGNVHNQISQGTQAAAG